MITGWVCLGLVVMFIFAWEVAERRRGRRAILDELSRVGDANPRELRRAVRMQPAPFYFLLSDMREEGLLESDEVGRVRRRGY